MIIYPAMDLMEGRVVRLAKGRFDHATTYHAEPSEALAGFAAAGADWAHVVDLDGARAGEPVQHDLIADLTGPASPKLQVAGGFRTRDQVARMLRAGVSRVVIGSLAVEEMDTTLSLFEEFGADSITLAFDVKLEGSRGEPIVSTRGWTQRSGLSLWDLAARYPAARHLLVTDISRDGMLSGPNFELVERIRTFLPHLALQASGGVRHVRDLISLAEAGAAGAIVGKALWEGRIDLQEAIRACS
jgi:phosphoribosylformimino-5-aminoimidazole carboxamide ribotide isomerase